MEKRDPAEKREGIRLNAVNRRVWQLLIIPLFTLIYSPVNRLIVLPKLGSGEPYVDMNGQVVTDYFSANTLAVILLVLLILLTGFLSVWNTRRMKWPARIAVLAGCAAVVFFTSFVFLLITLWH
ncbi:MAG: hypothetical protein II719_05240 [Clostridia bacterium]|nr:hypothetical protein [Clostridia bacterium]